MTEFTYQVLAFRQQESSPIQVAFVAHAGDVLCWAGIPRKSDELLTGFQRFKDDNRIDTQIVPFFQFAENCSPTAAIVALRSDSGLGNCILENTNIGPGEVVSTTLTITVDTEGLETDRVFECAREYVTRRLEADGAVGEESLFDENDGDESDAEQEAEDDAEQDVGENGADEVSVHLGSETLARMRTLLLDASNWTKPEFRKAIADYVKPAFLIDGQHRIFGAARLGEQGLPFMICGLFDAPWPEQVFQFTVVNLKPKRIPPSLITSIAALSLSRSEQDVLQKRLQQAGVKMDEVEIMSLVAYDARSPFADMVDMGAGRAGRESDLIGYGSMKRLAKVWYRVSRNSLTQVAKQLYATNNTSQARARWRNERAWFDLFCEFWTSIRDHYPETLWAKATNNNLFVGSTLWALQDALLLEEDGMLASHWKVSDEMPEDKRKKELLEKFKEVVSTTLVYLPAEMWTIPWQKSSLDTNQGREEVRDLFRRLISKGKEDGRLWKGWKKEEWFTLKP